MERPEINTFSITSDYEKITSPDVFPGLLKVLMAYAHKLVGTGTLRLEKSREDLAYDFAMEAIKRHIENPNKFDSKRNPDLVKYLKFNILRRLVSNFKESKGQSHEIAYDPDDPTGIKVMKTFVEEIDVHDAIDAKQTIHDIQCSIIDDKPLLELFELRHLKEYSRAETITELGITSNEYNNRIRRLDTVFRHIVKMKS